MVGFGDGKSGRALEKGSFMEKSDLLTKKLPHHILLN